MCFVFSGNVICIIFPTVLRAILNLAVFSDIWERNNHYSDTLDFTEWGEWGRWGDHLFHFGGR